MLRGDAEDVEAGDVESGLWGSMSRREWLDAEVLCALLWLLLMSLMVGKWEVAVWNVRS